MKKKGKRVISSFCIFLNFVLWNRSEELFVEYSFRIRTGHHSLSYLPWRGEEEAIVGIILAQQFQRVNLDSPLQTQNGERYTSLYPCGNFFLPFELRQNLISGIKIFTLLQ